MTALLEKKISEAEPTSGTEWGYDVMSLKAINPNSTMLPGLEKQLVEILDEAKSAYYGPGTSKLSDSLYDHLEKALRVLNPNHPFLDKVGRTME